LRIPFCDCAGSPIRGSVGMALVACVRGADLRRQIRPWNTKAVIAPSIHDHVGLRWHMAVDALRPAAAGLVMVVLSGVELGGQVAWTAEPGALRAQHEAVR